MNLKMIIVSVNNIIDFESIVTSEGYYVDIRLLFFFSLMSATHCCSHDNM